MDALKFEPVSLVLQFTKSKNQVVAVFNATVAELIDTFATRCLNEKQALIGHIKGFAAGPEGSYLRVSASGDGRSVDLEGWIAEMADTLLLTLNIHVFGISAERIRALLLESITDVATPEKARISIIHRLSWKGKRHEDEYRPDRM